MTRANSVLAIIGNPRAGGNDDPARSEVAAWDSVWEQAEEIWKSTTDIPTRRRCRELQILARDMSKQILGGVHLNPSRVKRRVKIGRHVQAIAYIHEKDGGAYVHGFGNCDPSEKDLKRGVLDLNALKTVTHVEMFGEPDGTVTLVGTKGQPLAALFD